LKVPQQARHPTGRGNNQQGQHHTIRRSRRSVLLPHNALYLARPTATLSLEAQQRRELRQKLCGD